MHPIDAAGDSLRVEIAAPADLAPYTAAKGSITVQGVSLTVNAVTDLPGGICLFTLNLIPHIGEVTLGHAQGRRCRQPRDRCARPLSDAAAEFAGVSGGSRLLATRFRSSGTQEIACKSCRSTHQLECLANCRDNVLIFSDGDWKTVSNV